VNKAIWHRGSTQCGGPNVSYPQPRLRRSPGLSDLQALIPFASSTPRRRSTATLRNACSSSLTTTLALIASACGAGAAALAATGHDHAGTYMLAGLETVLVAWLAALGWTAERTWARAGVIAAAAWVPTFLIASWAYAINPSLLDVGPPNRPIATVDLSLVCFIAGYASLLRRPGGTRNAQDLEVTETYVRVEQVTLSRIWAIAWVAIGCLGFCVIFVVTGGPVHFIRNVSSEGSLTRGRTYFVAAALALVFIAQVAACAKWSRGDVLPRRLIAGLVAALLLSATLGARELLAVPLVELALYYGLVRRRLRVRAGLPLLLAGALVIVVGVGMVKRYGNYVHTHPGVPVSRLEFLFTKGPGDFVSSYVSNTADGVRLIALGERTVPRYAAPEYGKEALRLLLQPLPSGIRPEVSTAPAIEAAIYPSSTDSYAQPLQLVSYLQFVYPGVVVAFLILGAVTAMLDHRLAAGSAPRRPSTLLLLVALTVEVPALLRSASAGAVAVELIEVVGLWAVARSSERLVEHRRPLPEPPAAVYPSAAAL
jgi:hypothetical protein